MLSHSGNRAYRRPPAHRRRSSVGRLGSMSSLVKLPQGLQGPSLLHADAICTSRRDHTVTGGATVSEPSASKWHCVR